MSLSSSACSPSPRSLSTTSTPLVAAPNCWPIFWTLTVFMLQLAALVEVAHNPMAVTSATANVSMSVFASAASANTKLPQILPTSMLPTSMLPTLQDWQQLDRLAASNFLVGVAVTGARLANGTTRCGKELEKLLKAVADQEFWSLKVLDSFGSQPRTFTWGNYYWSSNRQLCEELNNPLRIGISPYNPSANFFNFTIPFRMRYSLVYFRFSMPHYIDLKLPFENLIQVGLCLPKSCSLPEVVHYSDLYFSSQTFELQRQVPIKMRALDAKIPEVRWSFLKQNSSILFFSILLLVILFAIMAELLHRSKQRFKQQLQQQRKSFLSQMPKKLPATTVSEPQSSSCIEDFLLCFRLSENLERILSLEKSSSFLSAIAGLRTLICLWVTVFHVYYYSLYALSNAPMVFAQLENFAYQPVMQACFYVDIFFVISAFLLVYNFLSNGPQLRCIQQNSCLANMRLFLKAILQRYLRLTPVLIITMLLSDMFFNYLNMASPFRLDVHSGIYCKNNWWYNLLFLQNLRNMDDICCSWTWYLGCEMQFFILFTALLYIYAKNEQLAKIIYITLTLSFAVTSFLCNYYHNITFEVDIIFSTLNQLYVKPWVRINPYMGGAFLGWLLQHCKQAQLSGTTAPSLPLSSKWWCIYWSRTGTCCFWCCIGCLWLLTSFMTYWRSAPTWLVAFIMSFGKLLFALAIGGAIGACAWGRAGVLNRWLSARPFLFLNKFCYSVYMLAPVIVFAIYGLRMEATHFTEVASGADFIAVIVLALLSAFLMLLLLEVPMQRVSNRFLRKS